MIKETFTKIRTQLDESSELSQEHRQELSQLIDSLSEEIQALSETKPDDSNRISGFAQLSTQEAIRPSRRPELLKHSLDGLAASVIGMEADHPKITAAVNRLCSLLSNMGFES